MYELTGANRFRTGTLDQTVGERDLLSAELGCHDANLGIDLRIQLRREENGKMVGNKGLSHIIGGFESRYLSTHTFLLLQLD